MGCRENKLKKKAENQCFRSSIIHVVAKVPIRVVWVGKSDPFWITGGLCERTNARTNERAIP